ncbi:hypothetical protein DL769_003805 [Monosporascus sp. CRB-8-3]|nr:hypothetical protein DL769_003805 [Monosporascus sp. CRB-8-3]
MPSLHHLPRELLTEISSYLSSHDDKKSFRLVCRKCADVPTRDLFRRIRLSRLSQDKKAFEQIATHPHLAQYVRELVWYELHLEAWPGHGISSDMPENFVDRGDAFETILQLQVDLVSDHETFWIPKLAGSNWEDAKGAREIINAFRGHFYQLLQRMPNLTTFTSSPMPADRLLLYKGYPFQAGVFRAMIDSKLYSGNQGLFSFLLPALRQGNSTITTLHWAEETVGPENLGMQNLSADAFKTLTTIDLCLTNLWGRDKPIVPERARAATVELSACLRAADQLCHLKLCFEGTSDYGRGFSSSRIMHKLVGEPRWPQLTTFHVSDAPLRSMYLMIGFFQKHAKTLRHLEFDHCQLTCPQIKKLRSAHLQLDSIRLVDPGCGAGRIKVPGEQLCAYVNNMLEQYDTGGCSPSELRRFFIRTEDTRIRTPVDSAISIPNEKAASEADGFEADSIQVTIERTEPSGSLEQPPGFKGKLGPLQAQSFHDWLDLERPEAVGIGTHQAHVAEMVANLEENITAPRKQLLRLVLVAKESAKLQPQLQTPSSLELLSGPYRLDTDSDQRAMLRFAVTVGGRQTIRYITVDHRAYPEDWNFRPRLIVRLVGHAKRNIQWCGGVVIGDVGYGKTVVALALMQMQEQFDCGPSVA